VPVVVGYMKVPVGMMDLELVSVMFQKEKMQNNSVLMLLVLPISLVWGFGRYYLLFAKIIALDQEYLKY
jgi:hypothetical protein